MPVSRPKTCLRPSCLNTDIIITYHQQMALSTGVSCERRVHKLWWNHSVYIHKILQLKVVCRWWFMLHQVVE